MSQSPNTWLQSHHIAWRWAFASVLIWSLALIWFRGTGAGDYLESTIAAPVDFLVREKLGHAPPINPRLKVFAIDNSSFARMKDWVLTIDQWATILPRLASLKPRAIYIDAIFTKIPDPYGKELESLKKLESLDTPIIIGAMLSPAKLREREPLSLSAPDYHTTSYLRLENTPARIHHDPPSPNFYPGLGVFAYGTSKKFRKAFPAIGHIHYDRTGRVAAFVQTEKERVVPHLTLFPTEGRYFQGGRLHFDGHTLPLNERGEILINFPALASLYSNTYALFPIVEWAKSGDVRPPMSRGRPLIEEGDTILIAPLMYTGNTDFRVTPVGRIPGAYILMALLNSHLNHDWLKPVRGESLLVVVLSLAGMSLGVFAGAFSFWMGFIGLLAFWLASSLAVFTWAGIVIPWFFPTMAFVLNASTVFIQKSRSIDRRVKSLQSALDGAVSPASLASLLKRSDHIDFEARERIVTLMFIDVVGFSLTAESLIPKVAFAQLKEILASTGEIIHAHGGVINKTLGDGLLAFFGYSFDSDMNTADHATQAFLCGMKIQREHMRRMLEAQRRGEPIYPLRIGVNTAPVFLGNLGSESRIDFTVIGNGVNFAKRLESACEMHSLMISATTRDLIHPDPTELKAFSRQMINIKHHSELVPAFLIDPFHENPELRERVAAAYENTARLERESVRWPVHDRSLVEVLTNIGPGQLVNYSSTGIGLRLETHLKPSTELRIEMNSADGQLATSLQAIGLATLVGVARWSYPEGEGFVHGILLQNMTAMQSREFTQILHSHLQKSPQPS